MSEKPKPPKKKGDKEEVAKPPPDPIDLRRAPLWLGFEIGPEKDGD